MAKPALLWAARLIQEIAGGTLTQPVVAQAREFVPHRVPFRFSKIRQLIGEAILDETQIEILRKLAIPVKPADEPGWAVATVPVYRADVTREQDLAEEVLRIYGFNQITLPQHFTLPPFTTETNDRYHRQERLAEALVHAGLFEIRTNSLAPVSQKTETSVNMLNPLSEENAVMRESLLTSGLEVIANNLNRKITGIKCFEFGKVYRNENNTYSEKKQLALWLTGEDHSNHWKQKENDTDFFALKREMERLRIWLGLQFRETEAENPGPEWAYARKWLFQNRPVAIWGQLNPSFCKQSDVKAPVFAAVLEWELLENYLGKERVTYLEPPRFPVVTRDLSMKVEPEVSFEQLTQTIQSVNKKWIQSVNLFDVFVHPQTGERSYAMSVAISNPEKTLEESEIKSLMEKIMQKLSGLPGVELRV
jgi:phenylalanyl-tRNA synthetase beta chain